MSSSPCLFPLPSLSSTSLLNRSSSVNGFSNSFFVSNDDSTDHDSYSIEEDDVYPNNFLSTDLIFSIDYMEPNEESPVHQTMRKIPINYVVQYEPENENENIRKQKGKSKKGHSNSSQSNLNSQAKKPFVLRKGDWKCMNCYNINFGFRKCCNRCMFPKDSFFNETTIC